MEILTVTVIGGITAGISKSILAPLDRVKILF
jgi:hypothetical protein